MQVAWRTSFDGVLQHLRAGRRSHWHSQKQTSELGAAAGLSRRAVCRWPDRLYRSLRMCSIRYVDQLTRDQAERELVAWATANACRDEIIRAAYRAGVAKTRIHAITGIARTTIDRILQERIVSRNIFQMASREEIAQFLEEFIQDWPRDPTWNAGPFPFRPQPAMAYQITSQELADRMFEAVGFRALRLGSWLNTPDGELMASAIELLTPPPYSVDVELLLDALKIAATKQRTAEREKAVGIGVVAAIGAVLLAGAKG